MSHLGLGALLPVGGGALGGGDHLAHGVRLLHTVTALLLVIFLR